ncbi:MAG: LLM class flavin-dependent oxidoreductase [Chloroflexi bacterium]|nr:LLM class flavin-dependent oxidoreductase [Chloroflexota bacterium]
MRFGLQYDLRNPPRWRRPSDEHYAEFLDQVQWADENGFDQVSLPEHHFVEDGYLPSPLIVAAAIAARTKRIGIIINLTLLPLRHPVQMAEDAAIVDILSGGRLLELGVGSGYREAEYAGYGISMRQRPGRMEEGVEIIRRCWTEEEFDFEGRYWNLKGVRVMPKPVQKPHPLIVMGGASPVSARRAARIADRYNPITPHLWRFWREEMRNIGKDPGPERPLDTPHPPRNFLHVARDPEAAWKIVGPHAMHTANSYAEFAGSQKGSPYQGVSDPAELLARGTDAVMTPEEVVDLGKRMEAADPEGATLIFWPMNSGMPPELGRESMELVVKEVMPHFR